MTRIALIALLSLAAAIALAVSLIPSGLREAPFAIGSAAIQRVNQQGVRLSFDSNPTASHATIYRIGITGGDIAHVMMPSVGKPIKTTITDTSAHGPACYLAYQNLQERGVVNPVQTTWLGCTL